MASVSNHVCIRHFLCVSLEQTAGNDFLRTYSPAFIYAQLVPNVFKLISFCAYLK